MSRELQPFKEEAERLGIQDVTFVRRKKHWLMTGTVGGKTVREFMSATPSDWRAAAKIVARLRGIVFAATGQKPWLQ